MGVMQVRGHPLRGAGQACWHMPAALPPWRKEPCWCICQWCLQWSCLCDIAFQEALARSAYILVWDQLFATHACQHVTCQTREDEMTCMYNTNGRSHSPESLCINLLVNFQIPIPCNKQAAGSYTIDQANQSRRKMKLHGLRSHLKVFLHPPACPCIP